MNWLSRTVLGIIAFIPMMAFAEASLQLRDYWDYQAYLKNHPEEAELTKQMAVRIYAEPQPLSKNQDKPIQIDVVFPGEQLSDYWWRNLKALKLRLQELGIEYQLNQYSFRPSLDFRMESESFQQVLKNESDYLIFTLDTSQHRKFAYRVLSEGRTKLILLNITTPIKTWEDRHPLMYVGFDHVVGTHMLAAHYQKLFPNSADYGLVYYSPGYVSEARGDTFIKKMKSDYNLKRAYYTQANRDTGFSATLSMFAEESDLDFVYASSTDIAFGVADALQKLGRRDVLLNGWGGGDAELEALMKKDLDFTVMRMADDTGVAMAEAIKLDLQGDDVPRVFSGDYELVTKDDSAKRIQQLKKRAFRYSDQ